MMKYFITITLIFATITFTTVESSECPDVQPMKDLNLTEYGRATWYIQEQQINGYQNASCLFCTLATYVNDGKHVPFFKGTVLVSMKSSNIYLVLKTATNILRLHIFLISPVFFGITNTMFLLIKM